MAGLAESLGIEHVFVLMMENRSFDHLLGFSGITGTDAVTGEPTSINGLRGNESNTFDGQTYTVSVSADFRMPTDPGHEFPNVVHQLSGPDAVYSSGGPYPPIDLSGFVASYVGSGGKDPGEVMKCYRPEQLPILTALAREFVVCDNWHASLPGPTWPNRMFLHAASSGGLDHSPSTAEIVDWEGLEGYPFKNGDIFNALKSANVTRCLYGGDDFPMVSALKGIRLDDIRHYSVFAGDLAQAHYPYMYVFIEPSYDALNEYRNGTSQHPRADITHGEALIKATYESIRASGVWPNSILIITWDEHGGFYDHATPPVAVAPGDAVVGSKYNKYGFTFERFGLRVPAIIVSPLIPKNLIDHRLYDHASVPATIERLFGLKALTARDASAADVTPLITLRRARNDCPEKLPAPAASGAASLSAVASAQDFAASSIPRPQDTVDEGNLPAIVHAAMQQQMSIEPDQRQAIVQRVRAIKTRADAQQYLAEVQAATKRGEPTARAGSGSSV